ncbi:MAG: nucleotidyltransferase domain-containing protein [Gemmatimonadota bacterium]|nr:nucleotidyltransferase domain-containing protein [Gemmatimonadota bacterium]
MSLAHPPSGPGPDAELVATLRDILSGASEVAFAYLFGSVAKRRTRGASDVDVAVHMGGRLSAAKRVDLALDLEGRLERATGRPVQVVVLDDAPLELRFNVLAHGIPLCAQDLPARRAFYVDTGRRYYDMAPARALFSRRQRERIREGTFGG